MAGCLGKGAGRVERAWGGSSRRAAHRRRARGRSDLASGRFIPATSARHPSDTPSFDKSPPRRGASAMRGGLRPLLRAEAGVQEFKVAVRYEEDEQQPCGALLPHWHSANLCLFRFEVPPVSDSLSKAIRAAAKGSGWSVKRDILSRRIGDYFLAVHPRRGSKGRIEFRAKPAAWDHMLWSILQIEGNESKPVSFRFTGSFTCDSPALLQQDLELAASHEEIAQGMVQLSKRISYVPEVWQEYDLVSAIANERPQEPYRYHITRVVERICCGDRQTAREICDAALSGKLDLRRIFSSSDKLSQTDANGRRQSLSFFQLAQLWISRH